MSTEQTVGESKVWVDKVLYMVPDPVADELARVLCEGSRRLDALELAWGLIANAYVGDWESAPSNWHDAAIRWRDEQWHPILHDAIQGQSDAPERVSEGTTHD